MAHYKVIYVTKIANLGLIFNFYVLNTAFLPDMYNLYILTLGYGKKIFSDRDGCPRFLIKVLVVRAKHD